MVQKTTGLTYRKIDLHIHTPASACFKDKTITADAIVNKALKEKLDAIAITDHNTGAWIDDIKKASQGKLVVFPGVEISSTAGEKGVVHIVALLPEASTNKSIENLLGDLGIREDKYGTEEAFTEFSPSQVIETIAKHDGLAILAHANSTHGVMSDIQGNPRTAILNNPNLSAVEATQSDFANAEKKSKKIRVCDFLDGTNPEYPKLPVYQASDNLAPDGKGHIIASIGSRYTYFKLDEITLEGLRQCFCDPDVRIKLADLLDIKQPPVITSMTISQGFLGDQTIQFHEGLNSIVGGKGSGKSLIVEFLRFVLDQSSSISSIEKDIQEKLKERLGAFGKVTITLALQNGEAYQLTRSYNAEDNPGECIRTKDGTLYEGYIPSLFPVLAYSQNEVIKIAEDEDAQLILIDSFIDISNFNVEMEKTVKEFELSDRDLAKSIKSATDVASLQTELNTVVEKIKNVDLSLNNALFVEMKTQEAKKEAIEKYISFHNDLCTRIDEDITAIQETFNSPELEDSLKADKDLITCKKISDESLASLVTVLTTAKTKITQNQSTLSKTLEAFLPIYQGKRRQYEEMLVKAGGDQGKLEIERNRLTQRKTDLEIEATKFRTQLDKLAQIKTDRASLVDKFFKLREGQYQLRKAKYDELSLQSKGKLKLNLTYASNRDSFKNELINLFKGSSIRKETSDRIAKSMLPSEFIDLIVASDINALATQAGIDALNSQKVIEVLKTKEVFEEVLALSHSCFPEDTPTIEFKKEDGNYYPLSQLSVGQKCSALLTIALSEGNRPVIVDQPEDSLDVSSVYEDIVSKLRNGKERRQFILTTHNSSVGVASDSDNFIVLRSDANTGHVQCCGAIDRQGVKKEIVDHLEGGPAPYNLRHKKYNIPNRKP